MKIFHELVSFLYLLKVTAIIKSLTKCKLRTVIFFKPIIIQWQYEVHRETLTAQRLKEKVLSEGVLREWVDLSRMSMMKREVSAGTDELNEKIDRKILENRLYTI